MNNLQVHHPQIPQQQEPFVQQKVAYADQQKIYADQINQSSFTSGWLAFSEPSYLRGFLLAAGIAFAVSSPKIREIVSTGAIKTWAALQGGVEEFKEKIHDVRAEMSRESSEQDKE
jgi:hypothetical protein